MFVNASLKTSLLLPCILCLASCSLAPTYQRPAAPVPERWPQSEAYRPQQGVEAAPMPAWRTLFNDARLRSLIGLALQNNRDLRVAVLTIEKARAQYRVSAAANLPAVSLDASSSAARTPASVSVLGVEGTARRNDLNIGITAFELDLFGRVSSLKDAALARYLATEQARRSQELSLIAEVASAYLTLAADQLRLNLARDTLNSQEASYRLTEARWQSGAAPQLDVFQAATSVQAARADGALYKTRVAQDMNALTLLTGASLPADLLPPAELSAINALPPIPSQTPSTVLQQRPDVMQAEQVLQAANADVGSARAAFFPRIALTAAAGVASDDLAGLFRGGAQAWTLSPSISLPLFDGGANRAGLDVAKAQLAIEVAHYEKTVQTAFREVADALAEAGTLDERRQAQDAQAQASERAYQIYQGRYRGGADTYVNVLIAQRSMYLAQQQQISVRLAEQLNRVTLYKVLGGER
jgi:multidrug efflux system outer membrane protein